MGSVSMRWLSVPVAAGVAALSGSLAIGCACRPDDTWCVGNTRFTCEGGGRSDGSEDPFGRASGKDCNGVCIEGGELWGAFCSLSAEPVAACQRLRGRISVCWNNHVIRSCSGDAEDYPSTIGATDCGAKVCVEEGAVASCKAP